MAEDFGGGRTEAGRLQSALFQEVSVGWERERERERERGGGGRGGGGGGRGGGIPIHSCTHI